MPIHPTESLGIDRGCMIFIEVRQGIQQNEYRKSLYVYEMQIAFVKKYLKLPRCAAVRYTCLNAMQENQLVIGGFTQALHEGSLGRNVPLHLSGPIDTVPNAHDEKPIHLGGKATEQWLLGILRKQVPAEVIRLPLRTVKIIPLQAWTWDCLKRHNLSTTTSRSEIQLWHDNNSSSSSFSNTTGFKAPHGKRRYEKLPAPAGPKWPDSQCCRARHLRNYKNLEMNSAKLRLPTVCHFQTCLPICALCELLAWSTLNGP